MGPDSLEFSNRIKKLLGKAGSKRLRVERDSASLKERQKSDSE
jgi:hypothetical protein